MSRLRTGVLLVAGLAGVPALAAGPQRAAVVVGIEAYDHLPAELRIRDARQDAVRVAEVLETQAGFQQVRLLTDASATRAAMETLLRGGFSLGPEDLFLLYFVGQGIGGDFGDPRLLTYDADPAAIDQSGWPVAELALALQQGVRAGHILVVTDASHAGTLEDVALMGPTPDQWPEALQASMVLASSGPREIAQASVFAEAFVTALGGRADASGEGQVSSGELVRHLVESVPGATGDHQHPTVSALYDPTIVIADPGVVAAMGPEVIDRVKFVFHAGVSPTVQCAGAPVTVCDPSCYVWDLSPGSCEASAVFGERRQAFTAEVEHRGAWVCEDVRGRLSCAPKL
jgi:hypothetical protein